MQDKVSCDKGYLWWILQLRIQLEVARLGNLASRDGEFVKGLGMQDKFIGQGTAFSVGASIAGQQESRSGDRSYRKTG